MKYSNSDMINKNMNNNVYALRRKISSIIYDAKTLVCLPRVNVRITDNLNPRSRTLGMAQMGDCIV